MNVAGLDISTRNLDFVILNTENPAECEHRRVELAREDGRWWESARGMHETLVGAPNDLVPSIAGWDASPDGWLHSRSVTLLGIERPYGPSRGSIASLHVILGAVLATIPQHITVLEVRPAEMRRALGLPGNCAKDRMHEAIPQLLDRTATDWPEDAFDAWAVAWAAYRMCEKAAA